MLRSDTEFYKDLSGQVSSDVSDISQVDAKEMADLMKGVDDLDDALFGFTAKKSQDMTKKTPDGKRRSTTPKMTKGPKEFDELDPLGDISLSDDEFFGDEDLDKITKTADGTKVKVAKPEIDKTTKTKKIADLFGLDDEKRSEQQIEDKKSESRSGEDRNKVNIKKKESAAYWLGIKDSPKKSKTDVKSNLEVKEPFAANWKDDGLDDLLPKEKLSSKSAPVISSDQDTVFDKRTDNVSKNIKKNVLDDDDGDDNIFDLLEDKTSTKKTGKGEKETKKQVPKGLFSELFDDPGVKPAVRQQKQDRRSMFDKKDPFGGNPVFDIGEKKEGDTSYVTGDSSMPTLGGYMPSLGGGSRRPGTGRRREGLSATTPPSSLRLEEDWLSQPDSLTLVKLKSESVPSVEQKKSSVSDMPGSHPSSSKLPLWLGGAAPSEPTPVSSSATVQLPTPSLPPPVPPATSLLTPSPPPPIISAPSSTAPVVVVYQNENSEMPQNQTVSSEQLDRTSSSVLQKNLDLSKQTELAMQRTEAHLMTAVHLKEQRNSIEALTARQAQLLETQEKHITMMLDQHLKKQSEAEARLEAQNQRIGALMQMLMTDVSPASVASSTVTIQGTTHGRHNIIGNNSANVAINTEQSADEETYKQHNDTHKLSDDIHRLQIENSELKIQLELVEKAHKNELDTLSKIHRRETDAWQAHVGRLRKIIQEIGDEYKMKIQRLQENELEVIQLYKEKFENLQKESMLDLRQLCEFHRVTMEQITSMNGLISRNVSFHRDDEKFESRMPRMPLDDEEISAREAAIIRKEKHLSALQEEIKLQQRTLEEEEEKVLAERLKNDETERRLKREGTELRFKEKTLERDQEKLKEQHENQLQHIKELQENLMKEQAKIVEERLQIAAEKARLDALAKLQGVNSASSYDMMQARVEVHGALEAARELELELNEERQKLKQQQRVTESEKWRLQEIESDLSVRAQQMDSLVQVAEAKKTEGQKALEQAKLVQKRAEETLKEAEMKMAEVKEREQNLIKEQMEITREHVVLSKRREQLDQILPELSSAESLYLQPVSKAVIDPKLLIMKLKAEKELSLHS